MSETNENVDSAQIPGFLSLVEARRVSWIVLGRETYRLVFRGHMDPKDEDDS